MSFLSDYLGRMMNRSTIDIATAERLLSGEYPRDGDHGDLVSALDSMRLHDRPSRDQGQMATALAASARAGQGKRGRSGLRRVAAIGLAGAMFFASAGVALASDSAAPGDFLYEMDRALENVGIGAGGLEERVAEFEALLGSGKINEALVFLDDVIVDNGHAAVSAALDDAANSEASAADLDAFINANNGRGRGLDGRGFGHGVAAIAQLKNQEPPAAEPAHDGSQANGQHEHAGAKNDKETGPPDHAGPKETTAVESEEPVSTGISDGKETGPPAHSGPKDDKETGPPEHSGPKDGKATKPEQAGPKDASVAETEEPASNGTSDDKETGPPEHSGPKDGKATKPEQAGPKDK